MRVCVGGCVCVWEGANGVCIKDAEWAPQRQQARAIEGLGWPGGGGTAAGRRARAALPALSSAQPLRLRRRCRGCELPVDSICLSPAPVNRTTQQHPP